MKLLITIFISASLLAGECKDIFKTTQVLEMTDIVHEKLAEAETQEEIDLLKKILQYINNAHAEGNK